MTERRAEPLSPELVLVSPPWQAKLAREQLGDSPVSLWSRPVSAELSERRPSEPLAADPSDTGSNEVLAHSRTHSVRVASSITRWYGGDPPRSAAQLTVDLLAAVMLFLVGAILLFRLLLWIRWILQAAA